MRNIEWLLQPHIAALIPPNASAVADHQGNVLIDFGDGERVSIEKIINMEVKK